MNKVITISFTVERLVNICLAIVFVAVLFTLGYMLGFDKSGQIWSAPLP